MYDDDDGDMNGQDPFMIDAVVSKAYDRKLFQHAEFEQICARYWQLLHSQPGANRTSDQINKDQYTQLMKRVYKVLLPLYREDEMCREVAQEWIHDARGQDSMNLIMFQKMLFRVAHSWATHIDMDEYMEILTRIYERITCKKVIRGETGAVEIALPRIQVEIFQEKEEEDGAEWQSCLSDEYQDENYEYQPRPDPLDPETTKRYKRPLPDGQNEDDGGVMMNVRDPFLFKEDVQYYKEPKEGDFEGAVKQPTEKDVVVDLLAECSDVYPMGYPAEQFICKIKNDIIAAFIKLKDDRRKAIAEMRRQMFEDGAKMKQERPPEIQRDPGLLDAQGFQHEEFFTMVDTQNTVRIPTLIRVQDRLYNQMRQLFKDAGEIMIRPHFNYPSKQVLKGTAPSKILGSQDPATMINENMYNPALERRLQYKSMMCEMGDQTKNYCINVNYLINDPVYQTAFRSDVNRIESSNKMSIKPPQDGEIAQQHEFCNVNTTFQKTMQIMMSYKFQTYWTNKISDKQEPIEKQRDEKTFESEKQRKQAAMLKDSITSKNLTENFDEKNYLKLMRGPFYNMISREGSREDDFVNCTTRDLIDSANAELMKVLILGNPRSGKTTMAISLAAKLDLVRISADLWLEDLFKRIKEKEDNEEPEEIPEEEAAPEKVEEEEAEGEVEYQKDEEGNEILDAEGNKIPIEKVVEEPVVEEPKEPEEPKRAKKDEWLTDLEYEVRNTMRSGKALDMDQIDEIIKEMVNSPVAQTKGFIMDLTFALSGEEGGKEKQWGTRLLDKGVLVNNNELTHIIELLSEKDEVERRAAGLLITPQHGAVYSKWQRAQRNYKKPKEKDEDGNDIEEEVEEEENEEELKAMGLKGDLVDAEMVSRSCDSAKNFSKEVEYYNRSERHIFDEFIVKLYDTTYIKVDIAGMTPDELTSTLMVRMKANSSEPLRPIAYIIEDGASGFKELLTTGLNEEDPDAFSLPRQWSLWKTIDPVSLKRGQVEQGVPEFSAHFGNNVFVFQSEDNMKEFVKQPRFYIEKAPEMPPNFRVLMMGPRGIGVKTQAQQLEQLYGWRVVDFKEIVQEKLKEIMAMTIKLPNNITTEGPCQICLSEKELNDIKEGKPMPSWKFLPWIMEFLEIPLKIKDPPPPEPDSQTDDEWDEETKKKHIDKKKKKQKEKEAIRKAEEAKLAAKQERGNKRREAIEQGLNLDDLGLQESEEEIIIEDCSLDQLVLQENDDKSLPEVNKFILIGFPQTETHCAKLREFNIDFDRILFLSEEDNEEEPGKEVTKRVTEIDETAYDWAAELEIANAQSAVVKAYLESEEYKNWRLWSMRGGRDLAENEEEEEGRAVDVKEVMELKDLTGSIDEVHFKIRSRLDPFFCRPDDTTDDIRTSADYEEEDIHKLPKCDFGDYCPVTYVDDGFLVKGGSDEDGGDPNELYVNGKRYFFAGIKEMEKFKKCPSKYMIVQQQGASLPIQPPAPKFLITGNKCAGVSMQINLLCEKFKLEPLELENAFNAKQAEELKSRQRKRLLDRGFKGFKNPEEYEEDPDTGEMKPPVDTEIIEDAEDFDKAAQDLTDLISIIPAKKGLIIDGNWRPKGEDTEYAIPDLLKNSRRMPEIVIILKCKEEVSIKRNFADIEDDLKAEFERLMTQREENRVKKHEEDRVTKKGELEEEQAGLEEVTPEDQAKAVEEAMKEWEEARDAEEAEFEENDDDKPNLENMKEAKAEEIKATCEADETNLETLKTKLTEDWKAVEVLELDTSKISADFVHIKLLSLLKNHIKYRKDLVERAQAIPVKPEEVKVYEQSYTYKHSKFGLNSPISPFNSQKTKQFTVVYRERLYFPADKDEQDAFLAEPSKFVLGCEAIPLDIKIQPRVIVQGLPKSGKTQLCQRVSKITGAIHLQMEDLIEGFVDKDSSFAAKVADKLKKQGRDLDDLLLVQLIQKRVEMADCASQGWVLEGFPHTRAQAILMAKKSLLPSNVIVLNIPLEQVYQRTAPLQNEEFGCDRTILKRRLDYAARNMPAMVYFFQKFYHNVTSIDGLKSKWFMEDVAVRAISDNLKARMTFARDYQHVGQASERPCRIANLNMDRMFFKQSISQFGYFCSVSWKTEKKYLSCTHLPELSVLYKNLFYYFASEKQRELFVQNPKKFTENVIFAAERNIPRRMMAHKSSEIADTEKALLNYCPVTLADEEKLEKGNPILVISFKGEKYCFTSEEKLQKFANMPSRYSKTKLPVRIPPDNKPVYLYNLQKEENSVTFLEQALGSVVTKGLREIGEHPIKYPTLTVKETMLKLFAIFLKTENPANTEHMKQKYMKKMKSFLEKCTIPEELKDLAEEKEKKKKKGKWPQFKENYYNTLGQQYDGILKEVEKEKAEGFSGYMK